MFADKDKRYDVSNGSTLCKKCHDNFHMNNGYGNNTAEQFAKWFQAHQEGAEDRSRSLWALLVLDQWVRKNAAQMG